VPAKTPPDGVERIIEPFFDECRIRPGKNGTDRKRVSAGPGLGRDRTWIPTGQILRRR
jgi:hypothetical protein